MTDRTMRTLLVRGLARVCFAFLCLGIVAAPAWGERADRDRPILNYVICCMLQYISADAGYDTMGPRFTPGTGSVFSQLTID